MDYEKLEVKFTNEEKVKFIEKKFVYLFIKLSFIKQGKGLFAISGFKEGDVIFEENPLVCCQFAWNADYKYLACENCLRPLETAEENVRRLTNNKEIILPYHECCETKKELVTECEACGIKYCSNECQKEAWQK